MLDVIDHEYACLLRERLGQRSGNAAQGALGAGAQGGRTIPRVALDHRARRTEHRGELGDQARLAGAERSVEREQRDDREVGLQLCQLGLAADERHRSDGGHWIGDLGGSSPALHRDGERTVSKV